MKDFLTTGEVADACRLHKNTIIAALKKGMLSCSRTPGGHNRIPMDSVMQFMASLGIKPKDKDTTRILVKSGSGSPSVHSSNGNSGDTGNGEHGLNGNGGWQTVGGNGRRRILVVEDNKNLAVLLQKDFTEGGYEVEIAHSGYDAGYLTAAFQPELILLDIKLPDLSGEEVLRRLREGDWTKGIKVIVVSGYLDSQLKERLMALGADEFVSKPFSVKDLRATIGRVLRVAAAEVPRSIENQSVLA